MEEHPLDIYFCELRDRRRRELNKWVGAQAGGGGGGEGGGQAGDEGGGGGLVGMAVRFKWDT